MSRWICFLPAAALASLAGCGGSQHTADERYYLLTATTKIEYWQEAAAGVAQAAKQLGVVAETAGPDNYDPKGEEEQFRGLLAAQNNSRCYEFDAADEFRTLLDPLLSEWMESDD